MKKLFENFRKWLSEDELIESRLGDAKKLLPQYTDYVVRLSKNDPSGKNKYLIWMVKRLKDFVDKYNPQEEGALDNITERMLETINLFHKNLQRMPKKDINQYKTLTDLKNDVNALGDSSRQKRKKKKETAMEGSSIIFEDDNFFVVRPDTEEAACYYGKNTQWCISATTSRNYFHQYTSDGKVFYFLRNENLPEDDPGRRIAFVWDYSSPERPEEFYDATDDSITTKQVTMMMARNLEGLSFDSFRKKIGNQSFSKLNTKNSDLADKGQESFDKIVSEMESHLEDNPPDRTNIDEEMEEIARKYNEQYDHSYISWDYYDETHISYEGAMYFDLTNLKWNDELDYEEWQTQQKISDIAYSAASDASIYPSDHNFEMYGGDVKFDLSFHNDEYSLDPDGFDSFATDMGRYDGEHDEAMLNIVNALGEAGYVTDYPAQRLGQLSRNLTDRFKYLKVEENDESITVRMPLKVNLPSKIDLTSLRSHVKNIVNRQSQMFTNSIKSLLQGAQHYAQKQMSLFERLLPPRDYPGELEFQGFTENNDIMALYTMEIEWDRENAELKWIVQFLDYIDKNYEAVNDIFVDMMREIFKDKNMD